MESKLLQRVESLAEDLYEFLDIQALDFSVTQHSRNSGGILRNLDSREIMPTL